MAWKRLIFLFLFFSSIAEAQEFKLSKIQAKSIADMRLYQLSRQDAEERKNELEELKVKMAKLSAILSRAIKPTLCLSLVCLIPGFPSPTSKFISSNVCSSVCVNYH